MSLPKTLLAYQDCTELLNQAIEDDKGVRYEVPDYGAAFQLQTRIHYCRRLYREENSRIYDEDHQLYGKCVYDAIVCRIKNLDEKFYVYLERNDKLAGKVESLSAVEDPEPEPSPPNGVLRRV